MIDNNVFNVYFEQKHKEIFIMNPKNYELDSEQKVILNKKWFIYFINIKKPKNTIYFNKLGKK